MTAANFYTVLETFIPAKLNGEDPLEISEIFIKHVFSLYWLIKKGRKRSIYDRKLCEFL